MMAMDNRAFRMSTLLMFVGVALFYVFGVGGALLLGPLLISIIFLGIPHGSLDLVMLSGRGQILRISTYTLAVFGCLAVWSLVPVMMFAGFILLTLYHWGQGDLYWSLVVNRFPHLERSLSLRIFHLIVRGSLPMLGPAIVYPDVYLDVATATTHVFGRPVNGIEETDLSMSALGALGLLVVAYCGAVLRWGMFRGHRSSSRVDIGETLGLFCLFLLVHPLLSIGLYFIFWHATRHVFRVCEQQGWSARLSAHPVLRLVQASWLAFSKAWPATVGGILLLVVLGALTIDAPVVAAGPGDLYPVLGVYLVLLACLTVPHAVIVTWLDARDHIWSGAK